MVFEDDAAENCREVDEGLDGSGGGVLRFADMVGDDALTGANARGTEFAIRCVDRMDGERTAQECNWWCVGISENTTMSS